MLDSPDLEAQLEAARRRDEQELSALADDIERRNPELAALLDRAAERDPLTAATLAEKRNPSLALERRRTVSLIAQAIRRRYPEQARKIEEEADQNPALELSLRNIKTRDEYLVMEWFDRNELEESLFGDPYTALSFGNSEKVRQIYADALALERATKTPTPPPREPLARRALATSRRLLEKDRRRLEQIGEAVQRYAPPS